MPAKILLLALAALVLPNTQLAEAQQPKKVFRIGYLVATDPATESARFEATRQALRERGYIEGQNIASEYRYAERKQDRAPELAAELVRLKVDIIVVAGGPTWVQAVKKATRTIPIVMSGRGLDPVEAGLVESRARPGGNVTGLTLLSRELKTKPSGNKVSHVGAAHAGNTKGTPISRSNRWYVLILHYLMSKKHKRDRAD